MSVFELFGTLVNNGNPCSVKKNFFSLKGVSMAAGEKEVSHTLLSQGAELLLRYFCASTNERSIYF